MSGKVGGISFFRKITANACGYENIIVPLRPQMRGAFSLQCDGAVVQLVRIHACHAWGHGFESRTHRTIKRGISSAG